MIDLSTEHPLSLIEACRLVPPARGGRRTHISTLLRWITRGVVTADGRRVRLRACRLGSRWITSRESITEYMQALTPPLDAEPTATPRTPGKRQRAAEAAGKQLEKVGI
jgi:hypothetical protein